MRYPDSTKNSLEQRLTIRARQRWPGLADIRVRHHGRFSYVDGVLHERTTLKLCRLRYLNSAHDWGLAIYRASHEDYQDSIFPTGLPFGTCEDALDTACGLYLGDPTAWTQPTQPPQNYVTGSTTKPSGTPVRPGECLECPYLTLPVCRISSHL